MRRPRRLLLSVMVGILVGIALSIVATHGSAVVGSSALSVAPGATAATYENSAFGYQVDLPPGWRHSAKLSLLLGDHPYNRGHDVFTLRAPADEDAAVAGSHWLGPAWQGVVVIEVYRNSAGLTPLQWATRPEWDWRRDQVLDPVVLAGRPAVRITNGARFSVAYYVANGADMFVVGYLQHADWQPRGVKPSDLQGIVASFRFTR